MTDRDRPLLSLDLIIKCWNAEVENRTTTKELFQILTKLNEEKRLSETEICSQIKECDEIWKKKFESRSNNDQSKNTQTHPQAIYISRLLNFKNLPKPENS